MRNRGRILKIDKHRRAIWYASRGYPTTLIAEKLDVSPNTVRSWTDNRAVRPRTLASLARKIASLPDAPRRRFLRCLAQQVA